MQDSLAISHDLPVTSTFSRERTQQKGPVIIDLGSDSDDEGNSAGNILPSLHKSSLEYASTPASHIQNTVPMSGLSTANQSDGEVEEYLDPSLAMLKAKARARAAERARAKENGEKAAVAQLFISPEIPDSRPLLVKVRIDSTIGKARQAWCEMQRFDDEMVRNVFFTWKGTRIYDSTRIESLGIKKDAHGNLFVDGDTNLYDDTNVPKVAVEAWTEKLFQQRRKEDAAEAEARKKAAEASPEVEEKEPTPPPVVKVNKVRLILKAKGREDFKLGVNPDTTFAHIASAYKTRLNIDKQQPITLMFDGERLVPLDIIADSEVEDMDCIEVLFK